MLSLLLDTQLAPDQRDFATTAHESGHALLDLLNDVRDFYKQAFLLMFGGDAFIAMVPPGTPLPDCEFDKDSFMPTARMSCENSAPD